MRHFFQQFDAVSLAKIGHEVFDVPGRRRLMPPHSDIMLGERAPCSGLHDKFTFVASDAEHLLRCVAIQLTV